MQKERMYELVDKYGETLTTGSYMECLAYLNTDLKGKYTDDEVVPEIFPIPFSDEEKAEILRRFIEHKVRRAIDFSDLLFRPMDSFNWEYIFGRIILLDELYEKDDNLYYSAE